MTDELLKTPHGMREQVKKVLFFLKALSRAHWNRYEIDEALKRSLLA